MSDVSRHPRRLIQLAIIPIVLGIGLCLYATNPSGSPIEHAHQLCGECGLSPQEIEELIATMRAANAPREQLIRSFCDTFKHRADAEPCESCAQAVLDAAGR
jgi:predicted secreted protein